LTNSARIQRDIVPPLGQGFPKYISEEAGEDVSADAIFRRSGEGAWPAPSGNQIGWGRYENEAIVFSHDRGLNWTTSRLVTRIGEVSADLASTIDGTIDLTYDQKQAVGGSRARVSSDEGATWQEEIYALCWGHGGRTSSIGLHDGSILTLLADVHGGTRATIWRPH